MQWGVNGRMTTELGNTRPGRVPGAGQRSAAASPATRRATRRTPARRAVPTAVNLPATRRDLGPRHLDGHAQRRRFNLDVALSALEKKGQGKILSQPKVMMQNNVEAEMTQGVQIPIQTVSNNTVTVTFKDAALTLKVKPQITASNTVIMNISLENASPDYSREVNGIPPIDTQRAIDAGARQRRRDHGHRRHHEVARRPPSKDGVPGLSRIPLLGWLFRSDTIREDARELLIFITPRIKR